MNCTWCETPSEKLTACEGERLCWPCTNEYLDGKIGDQKAAYYGEQYRNTPAGELPVTPVDHAQRGTATRAEIVKARRKGAKL